MFIAEPGMLLARTSIIAIDGCEAHGASFELAGV